MRDFESFFFAATGHEPYGYQARIAREGLPDAVLAPTGAGKTGVILAWLWRRLHGPGQAATPRRLVYALPQRAVLDEVSGLVRGWLVNLGLTDEVALHVALGDRGMSTGDWREDMHKPAVVVGTVDTLVSKALNRGYGIGAGIYPIDFALVTNGAQWVLDEVQPCPTTVMTLRQLAGWAAEWGTAEPFGLTCLSALPATASPPATASGRSAGEAIAIAPQERAGELGVRLGAARTIRRAALMPGDYGALAAAVAELHRAGTTTLVVLNTAPAAQEVYRRLRDGTVACQLLHPRLRGLERDRVASPSDRVVVATGEIASSLDLSAATLVTEAAPWASMVRRAGRCNRTGTAQDAAVWWVPPSFPPSVPPAERLASDAACAELSRLEGMAVTGEELAAHQVFSAPDQVPVLGRPDFLALFDTSPGSLLDVDRYVCDAEDLDVDVAWATWTPRPDGAPDPEVRRPGVEYRCRVPIAEAVKLSETRPVWRFDHEAGEWHRAAGDPRWRPRPYELLLVSAADGGYDPSVGFDLASGIFVPQSPDLLTPDEIAEPGGVAEDAPPRPWQSLDEHSDQVRGQCAALLATLGPAISPEAARATVIAGHLHDVGKAHPVWQDALCALAAEPDAETIAAGRPWAKSGTNGVLHFAEGAPFRHELASLLLIDGPMRDLLAGTREKDLIRFLVLAHHGQLRVRVGDRRALMTEQNGREILGLKQGATSDIPPMLGRPATTLTVDLDQFSPGSVLSWAEAVLALRDRLGPFTLAYLETLVRISDWRASGARELAAANDTIDIHAETIPIRHNGLRLPFTGLTGVLIIPPMSWRWRGRLRLAPRRRHFWPSDPRCHAMAPGSPERPQDAVAASSTVECRLRQGALRQLADGLADAPAGDGWPSSSSSFFRVPW